MNSDMLSHFRNSLYSKKNQPVRDLVIDEDEATIVREMINLLNNHGYCTNRGAQNLNGKGIRTKNGTVLLLGITPPRKMKDPFFRNIRIYYVYSLSEYRVLWYIECAINMVVRNLTEAICLFELYYNQQIGICRRVKE